MNQINSSFGIVTIAICSLFSALLFWPEQMVFPLDDAYIHLVYAKNIVLHGEFSFNQGKPVYGDSSLLWPLLLAGIHQFGISLINSSTIANYSALTLALCYFAKISKFEPVHKMLLALLLSLAVFYNGYFVWHLFSGMETVFFTSVAFCACCAYSRAKPGMTWLFLSILILTRVNGVILLFLFFCADFVKEQRLSNIGIKGITSKVVYYLSLGIPYWIITSIFDLTLLPISSKAKIITYVNKIGIFDYGMYVVNSYWLYLPSLGFLCAIIIVGSVNSILKMKKSPVLSTAIFLFLIWSVADSIAYFLFFRSQVSQGLRYHFPIYSAAVIVTVITFLLVWKRKKKLLVTAVLISCFALVAFDSIRWHQMFEFSRNHIAQVYVKSAKQLASIIKPKERIASFDVGALKFFNYNNYMIDLGGINQLKTHEFLKEYRMTDYLVREKTDYLAILRQPNTDVITKFYRSRTLGDSRINLSLIFTNNFPGYPFPAILNSRQLDLFKVIGLYNNCKETNLDCLESVLHVTAPNISKVIRPQTTPFQLHDIAHTPKATYPVAQVNLANTFNITVQWKFVGNSQIITSEHYFLTLKNTRTKEVYVTPKVEIEAAKLGVLLAKDEVYQDQHMMNISSIMPFGEYLINLVYNGEEIQVGFLTYDHPYGSEKGIMFARERGMIDRDFEEKAKWVRDNTESVYCITESALAGELKTYVRNQLDYINIQIEKHALRRLGIPKPKCETFLYFTHNIGKINSYIFLNIGEVFLLPEYDLRYFQGKTHF